MSVNQCSVKTMPVNMVVYVFQWDTVCNVSVRQVFLVEDVKLILTNVVPSLATMVERAQICHKATNVCVRLDIPESIVKKSVQIVQMKHVLRAQCVKMNQDTKITHACAALGTLELRAI